MWGLQTSICIISEWKTLKIWVFLQRAAENEKKYILPFSLKAKNPFMLPSLLSICSHKNRLYLQIFFLSFIPHTQMWFDIQRAAAPDWGLLESINITWPCLPVHAAAFIRHAACRQNSRDKKTIYSFLIKIIHYWFVWFLSVLNIVCVVFSD